MSCNNWNDAKLIQPISGEIGLVTRLLIGSLLYVGIDGSFAPLFEVFGFALGPVGFS